MQTGKRYELLAPVGDMDMFEAALAARANAVYLAGYKFGARAYASNFDLEQLNNLVIRAHKANIAVYLTVNTLVKDKEFEELYDYLSDVIKTGVDAFIIQDLGVYYFIKKYFPQIELHASTQMTVNNVLGAMYLEKLGFERIVVGREISLEEIRYIKESTNLEIEAFVHGSLCVCVSGQCLMSGLIGQRSGNRGRCAQPCRKVYDIYNFQGKKISQVPDTYISARDLMTIDYISELVGAGVYSLKIEGRMKKAEYVYSVVSEYKKALEGHGYKADNLTLVSNRKFTKGFFFGDFGKSYYNSSFDVAGLEVALVENSKTTKLIFSKDVFKGDVLSVTTVKGKKLTLTMTEDFDQGQALELKGYRDLEDQSKVFKIFSQKIVDQLEEDKNKTEEIPITIKLFAHVGQKLVAEVKAQEIKIKVESDFEVQSPMKNPTSELEIRNQLGRLGNTSYVLNQLVIDSDQEIFLPKSKLNDLRREFVERLDYAFRKVSEFKFLDFDKLDKKALSTNKEYNLSFEYFYELNEDIDYSIFKRVYVHDMTSIDRLSQIYKGQIYFVIPRIIEKEAYEQMLVDLTRYIEDIDGFAASSLGDVEAISRFNMPLHLEASMNVFNSYTMEFYRRQEINDFSLSHELNHEEMKDLKVEADDLIEIVGHGRLAQMLLKHCPASIVKGCVDDSGCKTCPFSRGLKLQNDQDTMYLDRNFGYSEVLTQRPIDLINEKESLDQTPVNMLRIVDRGQEDIKEIIKKYKRRFLDNTPVTFHDNAYTGHFNKGVI